jgi:two-component system, LytTR family, response regulator
MAKKQAIATDKKNAERDLICINTAKEMFFFRPHDIIRLEASRNYTNVFLVDKTKIVSSKNLKEFETVLRKKGFIRIHKSHLVNSIYVNRYLKGSNAHAVMISDEKLSVSENGRKELMEFLKSKSISF